MEETLLLATSGDTIKLWDAKTYSFQQEIPSESGHVSGLIWNQDGKCLASISDSGKEIHLSAVRGKSAANIGVIRGIEPPSCLSFACRSPHYLAVGSTSGTVTIWNAKSQSKKKVFAPTDQAISKVVFSQSDSHVAAATKKGNLYTLSIVNNLTAGPYKLFNNEVVSDLAYSRVKKSLLGCCSESGSVALYDTHANKIQHTFTSAHDSPVAAIAFSPVNELLLVSVGYDKKLSCFNVQTRQHVMTHRSADPLTSITFLGMGQLVALGTMTGQVLIHDMRSIRTPVAAIKAHRSAVTNVLLQPISKSKSVSSSKTGQKTNTTTTLSAPVQRQAKSCSDKPSEVNPELTPKTESKPNNTSFDDTSVFSPIRDTKPIINSPQTSEGSTSVDNLAWINSVTEKVDAQSLFSPIRHTANTNNNNNKYFFSVPPPMDVDEDNVLSPIRDTTHIASDSDSCYDSPAIRSEPQPNTTKDVVTDLPVFTITNDTLVPSTPEQMSGLVTTKLVDISNECTSTLQPIHPDPMQSLESSPRKKRAVQSPVRASTEPALQEITATANTTTTTTIPAAANTTTASGSSDLRVAASSEVPPLQIDLIRNCMQEVLEDFQDETNSRLIHLQYVMTKRFIEQQEKMEELHRQYSLNEDLLAEVERLRQQVAHLQAKY